MLKTAIIGGFISVALFSCGPWSIGSVVCHKLGGPPMVVMDYDQWNNIVTVIRHSRGVAITETYSAAELTKKCESTCMQEK